MTDTSPALSPEAECAALRSQLAYAANLIRDYRGFLHGAQHIDFDGDFWNGDAPPFEQRADAWLKAFALLKARWDEIASIEAQIGVLNDEFVRATHQLYDANAIYDLQDVLKEHSAPLVARLKELEGDTPD